MLVYALWLGVPAVALAAALAAALWAVHPPQSASSGDSFTETLAEINAATAIAAPTLPALRTVTPPGPASGSAPLELGGGVRLRLPATGSRRTQAGTAIYNAAGGQRAQLAVQQVALGTRALINVDAASAPERYEFALSGDVARLRLNADGSVAAFNAATKLTALC